MQEQPQWIQRNPKSTNKSHHMKNYLNWTLPIWAYINLITIHKHDCEYVCLDRKSSNKCEKRVQTIIKNHLLCAIVALRNVIKSEKERDDKNYQVSININIMLIIAHFRNRMRWEFIFPSLDLLFKSFLELIVLVSLSLIFLEQIFFATYISICYELPLTWPRWFVNFY